MIWRAHRRVVLAELRIPRPAALPQRRAPLPRHPRLHTAVRQKASPSCPCFLSTTSLARSPTVAMSTSASAAAPGDMPADDKATATDGTAGTAKPEPELPPLTAAQFREYNRLAERMEAFHNHFRQAWTMMYQACEARKRPAGMTIRQFLDEGLHLIRALTAHHSIEEAYVFPALAARMPEFQQPGKSKGGGAAHVTAAHLVQQHRAIHEGMDAFEAYLRQCRNRETELDLAALKAQMDSWGGVLWQHLADEVAALGADNMRKYWTPDEVRQLPM